LGNFPLFRPYLERFSRVDRFFLCNYVKSCAEFESAIRILLSALIQELSAIFGGFSANIFKKSGNLPLKIADNSGIRADSKILIADSNSPQLFTSDM